MYSSLANVALKGTQTRLGNNWLKVIWLERPGGGSSPSTVHYSSNIRLKLQYFRRFLLQLTKCFWIFRTLYLTVDVLIFSFEFNTSLLIGRYMYSLDLHRTPLKSEILQVCFRANPGKRLDKQDEGNSLVVLRNIWKNNSILWWLLNFKIYKISWTAKKNFLLSDHLLT